MIEFFSFVGIVGQCVWNFDITTAFWCFSTEFGLVIFDEIGIKADHI